MFAIADAAGAADIWSRMMEPVSYNEEAAWTESRLEPALFAKRLLRVTADLPSGLGVAAVRAVADQLVRRHPILRTAYPTLAGEPRRLVLDEYAHEVRAGKPSALPAPGAELRPSDVVRVWQTADGAPQMGIDLSEMITDPWSCARLQGEMAALLAAAATGEAVDLEPVSATYAEFAAEQRDHVASSASAGLRDYWVAQLGGATPAGYLLPDGPDPSGDLAGERISVLTEELMEYLRALTTRHRLTPFMAVIALLVMVLASLSGDRELSITTAMASRTARWAGVQGNFANTLVLRMVLPAEPTFAEVVTVVRRTVLGGLAHKELPYLAVRKALGEDQASQPPLRIGYLANRGHQFTSLDARAWGEEWTEDADFSPRPIDMGFAEDAHGRVSLWVNYDATLFTHSLVKRLVDATWTTLRLVGANPEVTCAGLADVIGRLPALERSR
jgi:Condensation domain